MNKIFKYRPLSDFLFKELYYQEIFFASYSELNDPLDLFARIDFNTDDIEAIDYLVWFIVKTQIDFENSQKINFKKLFLFENNKIARNNFKNTILVKVLEHRKLNKNLWINDIIEIINDSISKTKADFSFDSIKFRTETVRLTNKFLKNSSATCFSKTNNEPLMWSHYASKHSGICLEFNLENGLSFPYIGNYLRKPDNEKYKERISKWNIETHIYWDKLSQVGYQEEQPFINFYNFAVIFENEYDCDLIGLSKSWTHKYANELESVFSTKTIDWKYEQEWRAIHINFDKPKEPEERISHYPIEALSGIYFGVNTPENVKNRIYKLISSKTKTVDFYECILNGNNKIEFENWEYFEE